MCRKGISNYYNGKSKSFTNLADENAASALASCSSSSMKDLAKQENPYSRRRRNLLCHKIWEKSPRGRISKRQTMSSSKSKSALTLAVAVAAEEGSSSGGDSSTGTSPTSTGSPPRQMMTILPPLYTGSQGSFGNMKSSHSSSTGFCAWRSCSVAEIPRCFPATTSGIGSTDS